MPGAYSGDLRRRVVAVLDGGQPAGAVARRFVVGRSTVDRWLEAVRGEGRLEAKPMRGGPRPAIRDESEAALRRLVASDNHLTLAEYWDRLAAEVGVRVHPCLDARTGSAALGAHAQKRRPCARPSGTRLRSWRRGPTGARR